LFPPTIVSVYPPELPEEELLEEEDDEEEELLEDEEDEDDEEELLEDDEELDEEEEELLEDEDDELVVADEELLEDDEDEEVDEDEDEDEDELVVEVEAAPDDDAPVVAASPVDDLEDEAGVVEVDVEVPLVEEEWLDPVEELLLDDVLDPLYSHPAPAMASPNTIQRNANDWCDIQAPSLERGNYAEAAPRERADRAGTPCPAIGSSGGTDSKITRVPQIRTPAWVSLSRLKS
jgi:hypothetical protein